MIYSKVQFCFKPTLVMKQHLFVHTDVCKPIVAAAKTQKSQSCECARVDVGQITLKVQHLAMISGH